MIENKGWSIFLIVFLGALLQAALIAADIQVNTPHAVATRFAQAYFNLDPDKVGNNMAEAAVQAEILKQFQAENPPPAPPPGAPQPGGPQQAPAGAQVQDTQGSGGGTIGTGTAPTPGEQGFSGNTGPQVQ